MLKAGYVLCEECGTATDEAIYSSDGTLFIQLKRASNGRFFAERYIPQKYANDPNYNIEDGYFRFDLLENYANGHKGVLHTVEVACYRNVSSDLSDTNEQFVVETITFSLVCPNCSSDTITYMPKGLGNLPTYVIAVVGARTVGKSSWINSVTSEQTLAKLSHSLPVADGKLQYILTTNDYTDNLDGEVPTTAIGDMGATKILKIIKRDLSNNNHNVMPTAVANILLVDFAGEVFAKERTDAFKAEAAHFFSGGVGYNGVDGILFVTDPKDTRRQDKNGNNYSIANTFKRVYEETNLLNNIPFAFIINKVDLLFNEASDRILASIENPDDIPELPLLSSTTFGAQDDNMYQAENLLPRIALETHLAKKQLPSLGVVSVNTRCAGFFVKTADFDQDNNPDYSHSINVADPLLWLLNVLDIYPIN